MRRILVVAAHAFALPAAASVALRTRTTGPVGVIILPLDGGADSLPAGGFATDPDVGPAAPGIGTRQEGKLPLPTPGAARVAGQLRRAGHRATARWRLVVCRPETEAAVDDAAAILEAACGSVTAVADPAAEGGEPHPLRACELVVGVVPVDAPDELLDEAGRSLLSRGAQVSLLKLDDPGLGRSLPLAGICPPPDWAEELDGLDEQLRVA